MDKIIVTGGNTIQGEVTISGAKNAVLPIIIGTLLAEEGICVINEVPHLADVETIMEVLECLGAKVTLEGSTMTVDSTGINNFEAPYHYIQKMRASLWIMGPLLARLGRAKISMPGGCAIGTRPIDLHLKGLEALGATINIDHGNMDAKADGRLKGAKIYLDFPSVGATEHIMMAAVIAEGTTIISEIDHILRGYENIVEKLSGVGAKISVIETEE